MFFFTYLLVGCNTSTSQIKVGNEKKPNIVLIFADDLGWVDVSTGNTNENNSSKIYETPVIDKLAS